MIAIARQRGSLEIGDLVSVPLRGRRNAPARSNERKESVMASNDRPFPDTLVLSLNKIADGAGCAPAFAQQFSQGNTFAVPFDMRQAPLKPGDDGLVYLTDQPENNFKAAARYQLSNEGLSNVLAFYSITPIKAEIFGTTQNIQAVSLIGTPSNGGYTWSVTVLVNGTCIVTNGGSVDESVIARLRAGKR
jgi:hypothetical protein